MKPLLILFTASAVAWAQGGDALRARELFYTPPPSPGSAPAQAGQAQSPTAAAAAPIATPKPVAKKIAPKQNKSNSEPVSASTQGSHAIVVENAANVSEAIPLGIRYSVLKRDAAGKFIEVDPEAMFHSGDRIRLEVQANSTGYLYVVAQGSSGNWQVLFPARQVDNGSNLVHRGETRQVPGANAGQFVFDEQAGAEKLFFILTRQPAENIDRLIYSVGGQSSPSDTGKPVKPAADPGRTLMAQATLGDDVISQIRGQMASRDLIFEKVEGARVEASNGAASSGGEVKYETAAYVVNPSTAPDARLVVDVKLTHQ